MFFGAITQQDCLSGVITQQESLSGVIAANEKLQGSICGLEGLSGKVSVSVRDVPYYETSNASKGITVYIGKEIDIHGNK